MPLVIGARLGPYEVLAPIGAGGMGEVYRATDGNLKRSVAIGCRWSGPGGGDVRPHRALRFGFLDQLQQAMPAEK